MNPAQLTALTENFTAHRVRPFIDHPERRDRRPSHRRTAQAAGSEIVGKSHREVSEEWVDIQDPYEDP
jgi:hypothetical protein